MSVGRKTKNASGVLTSRSSKILMGQNVRNDEKSVYAMDTGATVAVSSHPELYNSIVSMPQNFSLSSFLSQAFLLFSFSLSP